MKLYICFSTGGNDHHACAKAFRALQKRGINPDIEKVYGSGRLPKIMQTKGRKKLASRTNTYYVPVLELDDKTMIQGSEKIEQWVKTQKN